MGRRLAAGVAALPVVVVTLASLLWLEPWKSEEPGQCTEPIATTSPEKPVIAVLPFENLSDELALEHFADGLTIDLTTDLSKISGLLVNAQHSVFAYKDKSIALPQIARELGVRYVVTGSVRGARGRTRINVQLVNATTGSQCWAERYDSNQTDVFTLQDRVIESIVAELEVVLTDKEKARIARRPTGSEEAYDYYQRAERRRLYADYTGTGRYGLRTGQAVELYREAIAIDPEFAEAYAGLAMSAFRLWSWDQTDQMSGPVARRLAYDSAGKALDLDPENPLAYSVLALVQGTDGEHELALESMRQALSIQPSNAMAYTHLAELLVYAGQPAAALAAMQTAFRLEPKPPTHFHGSLGWVLFFNHHYAEAIEHLEIANRDAGGYEQELAMSYAQVGRLEEAKVEVEKLLNGTPFGNLAYYRVYHANYKRKQDVEHQIEALRKAGVPEWPYGAEFELADRLDTDSLMALTFGHTWYGRDFSGNPFVQQFTDDGRVALRSHVTLLTGTAEIRNDLVCIRYPAALLGREDCGNVYKNPSGSARTHDEYVRVAIGEIYFFSVKP